MGLFDGPKTTTKRSGKEMLDEQSGKTGSFETSQQQTSTGHTTAGQEGLSTTANNIPAWLQGLHQNIGSGFASLFQGVPGSNRPLYGPQQEATFREGVGQQMRGSQQDLQSLLASSGALNSGRAAQVQTGLANAANSDIAKYLSQVPLLNAQNQQQNFQQKLQALGAAGGFNPQYGSTTTSKQNSFQDILNELIGSSSGTSQEDAWQKLLKEFDSTETSQQSGGLMRSLLGGLINAGLGFATGGLSNLIGGGGKGFNSSTDKVPDFTGSGF